MDVNLRGLGGGLRVSYADAVTFKSWALQGNEQGGFSLTATPARIIEAYCASTLTAWVPVGGTAWEWDGVSLGSVEPTSLTVTLRGMPRIVKL